MSVMHDLDVSSAIDVTAEIQKTKFQQHTKTAIVVSDFQSFYLSEPIEQQILLQNLAWQMTVAHCVDNGLDPSAKAHELFPSMMSQVEKYSVSPNYINHRQYNYLPSQIGPNPINITASISQTHENIFSNPYGLSWDNRIRLFEKSVIEVMQSAYKTDESLPNSIIHTTCTGYLAPSPLQTFLSNKNWLKTQVLHAYHMGCYAAIPSVELALGLISASHHSLTTPKQRVDVLHTEIAALHLNVMDTSPNNIINMTLFGDSFIKYSIATESDFKKKSSNSNGLKVLAIETLLIPNSLHEMTWVPGPFQFDMYLSKNVPLLVGGKIHEFLNLLCSHLHVDFEKNKNRFHYAIHPGGPKILDHVAEILKLPNDSMHFSRNVLRQLGNMSSATLPHVWKDMIDSPEIKIGEKIITVAFGPGLTATGIIFEKI